MRGLLALLQRPLGRQARRLPSETRQSRQWYIPTTHTHYTVVCLVQIYHSAAETAGGTLWSGEHAERRLDVIVYLFFHINPDERPVGESIHQRNDEIARATAKVHLW